MCCHARCYLQRHYCVNIVAVQAYLCHIVQGFMLPYKGTAFQAAANDTIAYQLQ